MNTKLIMKWKTLKKYKFPHLWNPLFEIYYELPFLLLKLTGVSTFLTDLKNDSQVKHFFLIKKEIFFLKKVY